VVGPNINATCLNCTLINGLARLSLINNAITAPNNIADTDIKPTFTCALYTNLPINNTNPNNNNPNAHWSLINSPNDSANKMWSEFDAADNTTLMIFPLLSYRSEIFNLEVYQEYKK
jgi:hypothetical protein